MIYVGIDVAKDKHDCFITNSEGEVLFQVFTIQNNRDESNDLFSMIQSRFIRRIQLPGSPGSSKPLVRTRKKRGCVIYVCSDRCCQIYLQRKISERKHCNVAITRAAKKLIRLICAMVKIRQAFYKTA